MAKGIFFGLLKRRELVVPSLPGWALLFFALAAMLYAFFRLVHPFLAVEAPLGGSVWKMLVKPGDRVEKGAVIAIIEAMKTECDVASSEAGVVRAVYAAERQAIAAGAPMIALEPVLPEPA